MGRSKEFRGGPTEYAFANFDVKAGAFPPSLYLLLLLSRGI